MTRKKNKEKQERERELKAKAAAAAAAGRSGKTYAIFTSSNCQYGQHTANAHMLRICGCFGFGLDGPEYQVEKIRYFPSTYVMPPVKAALQEDRFFMYLFIMTLFAISCVGFILAYEAEIIEFWEPY